MTFQFHISFRIGPICILFFLNLNSKLCGFV